MYIENFLYLEHVTSSSISLRTYSRLHLSFVAGIHRSQEAIRSFPIRERRAHFPDGTRLALYSETGSGRSGRTAPRSRIEEPARFLPFVAHGSATRDIVSIVPLIGKIKVFQTTTTCTWSHVRCLFPKLIVVNNLSDFNILHFEYWSKSNIINLRILHLLRLMDFMISLFR